MSLKRFLSFLVLFFTCSLVFAQELDHTDNALRWQKHLEIVRNPSIILRCTPYKRSVETWDYDEVTKKPWYKTEETVLYYSKAQDGGFIGCSAAEALAVCSLGYPSCIGFTWNYLVCTPAYLNSPNVSNQCQYFSQHPNLHSMDPTNPNSEIYGLNETGASCATEPGQMPRMSCGDPIQLQTGNSFQTYVDYKDPLNRGLDFVRYYNSKFNKFNTPLFVQGWTHSFSRSLILPPPDSSNYFLVKDDGALLQVWPSASADPSFKGTFSIIQDSDGNKTGYTITYPNIGTDTFNAGGALIKHERFGGGVFTISQGVGYNKIITDDLGRTLAINISALSVVLPNGATLSFDIKQTQTSINNSPKDKYTYFNNYLLTSRANSSNVVTSSWGYATDSRANLSIWNAGLSKAQVTYGDTPLTATETDEFGNTIQHTGVSVNGKRGLMQKTKTCATSANGCVNTKETYSYNDDGTVAKYVNDFTQTCYTYSNGHVYQIQEGVPIGANCPATGTATATYDWNTLTSQVNKIARPNTLDVYTYDSKNRLTSVTAYATNDSTGVQGFSAVTAGQPYTVTYSYNDKNQPIQYTINGKSKTLEYNSNGFLTKVTDSDGFVTNYSQHTSDGLPQSIILPSGLSVSVTYDGNNNITSFTTDEGESYTWSYLADGTLTQKTINGNTVALSYDSSARLQSVQSALEVITYGFTPNTKDATSIAKTSNGLTISNSLQYNELGLVTSQSK